MGDVLFAVVVAAVIIIAIIAGQIVSWLARRQRASLDPYGFLESAYHFERLSDRFVVDHRVIRYAGNFRSSNCRIEVGFGPGVQYGRIDFFFEREVPMGLRISSEHEESVFTRVMRLREMNIGLHHFDSQFILLSRNEDRLKQLLDHDVRRMLMSLRSRTGDVRLNDDGLHLLLTGTLDRESFVELLEEGAQLSSHVFRRGEDLLAEEARRSDEEPAPAFTPLPGTLKAIPPEPERSP